MNDSQNCSQNCSQNDSQKRVDNSLTDRQKQILQLVQDDSQMIVKMIAKKLKVSEPTINRELREINKVISVRWEGSPKKGAWIVQNQ